MASGDIQSIGAVVDPVAVESVVQIPLDRIDASHRLREISEAHAQVMAASFAERGQRTPVEVVRHGDGFRLVTGGHRYRAAQIAELGVLRCIVTDADEAEQRLREIDENLIRHELTALDRARFLLERKRIYEALNPAAKLGANQWTPGFANLANPRFTAEVAEKTGLSERTVQRACEIASRLDPETVRRLSDTPLARNQAALEALAKHPGERQRAALDHLLAEENPARSVAEAFNRLDGRVEKVAAEAAHLTKAIDLWGRMGAKERREFLRFLADADLPKGCNVEVGR